MKIASIILQDLKHVMGHIPDPLPEEIKSLCSLSENIIEKDLFRAAATIDKRKIHEALLKILETAKLPLAAFQQIVMNYRYHHIHSGKQWPMPLWEIFWRMSLDRKAEPIMQFVDLSAYSGIYGKAREHLAKAFLQNLVSQRMKNLTENQRNRILPNLFNCLSNFLLCSILLSCKHVPAITCNATLQAMGALLELTLEGYGTLYAAGPLRKGRIEIRLPVWAQQDYPREIIECKEMPELTVAVVTNGVYVPEKAWLSTKQVTARDILDESNVEIRRLMVDKVENQTFLRESGARLIDEQGGLKLYRISLDNNSAFNLVRCVCPSTGREYYLRVPPGIVKANAAIAWTFNVEASSYRLVSET